MPEPEPAVAEGDTRARRRRRPAAKKKAAKKKGGPAARPAIIPSQNVDHTTPPAVLEGVIYPVLGEPVDLDPCSNPNSIVRARRSIMLPPEDGAAVPAGWEVGDGLKIEWRGKVFFNPPYGDKLITPFILKAIASYRHNGAEIIGLLPASVSAEWFDLVVGTARAAFLWGPGEGGRRLQFGGNEHGATFASVVAYWGPDLPKFVRHAIRCCHPWYPEYDLRLTRAMLADANGSGEAMRGGLALADDLLAMNRHDDLASALLALGDTTVGEIMDYGRSAILQRIQGLSAYELASALVCSTRPGVHWMERRLPRTPAPADPRQLGLPEAEKTRSADETVDDAVMRHVRGAGEAGLGATQLMDCLKISRGEVRGALQRLRKAETVIKTGTTNRAAYVAAGEEGQQDATGQSK